MPLAQALSGIVGGLVFFLIGLHIVNEAFERLSSRYIKVALNLLTNHRPGGVFVGIVMGFLLTSSSASTVLLVGMGGAGLLTLGQALAVVLGAAIGATLVIQVIAFDIGNWSLYLIAAGFLIRAVARYQRGRDLGIIVAGVGFLFYGLALMKGAVGASGAVTQFDGLRAFLTQLSRNAFYLFLAGIAAAAVLQSSAATLAVVFALGLPFEAAVPVVLGAAIGTTAGGLVSGAIGRPIGRQIALGHFIMKLFGASFFMLILPWFIHAVEVWSYGARMTSGARVIANANTIFNVANALIFLPLLPLVERFVVSITDGHAAARPMPGLSYADLEDAAAAVEKARERVAAMGRTVLAMLRKDLTAFAVDAHKVTDEILRSEDTVDTWDAVLTDFLSRIDEARLSPEANETRNRLIYVTKDIEYISDIVASELVPLARKKSQKGLDFSIEASVEFDRLHRLVADDLSTALDLLEGKAADAARVLDDAGRIDAFRGDMVRSHIRRVQKGVVADVLTSRIFLDAVASLRVIHYYIWDIIQVIEQRPPRPR